VRAACLVVLAAGCGRFGFSEKEATDAATVRDDGLVDSTQSSVCDAAALCDGFEGSDVDAAWSKLGAVSLDDTFAHNGSQSVHLHVDAVAAGGQGEARITNSTLLASTPGPLWIRAWIRLGALPAGNNHMELICTEQSSSPFYGDCVFVYSDATALYTQFSGMSMQGDPPPVLPWFCYVWQIERSTTSGDMHLTSDVVPSIDLLGQQTDSATNPVDTIAIGAAFYSGNTPTAQPALEVWIDDVIVSTSPVTCSD
jgi:hypothetical protein